MCACVRARVLLLTTAYDVSYLNVENRWLRDDNNNNNNKPFENRGRKKKRKKNK